jgi:hypothetical protein
MTKVIGKIQNNSVPYIKEPTGYPCERGQELRHNKLAAGLQVSQIEQFYQSLRASLELRTQ